MKHFIYLFALAGLVSLQASCQSSNENNKKAEMQAQNTQTPVEVPSQNGLEKAYKEYKNLFLATAADIPKTQPTNLATLVEQDMQRL